MIANPQFGTVVSESGSAYTWAENSHEFRLTPWHNDPVTDTSGEAIYLRDEETGRFWSPSPLPARGHNPYVARHGFGYSIFEYTEDGIATELCVYRGHRRAGEVLPGSRSPTARAGRASFRSPATGNGCWANCGARR